MHYAGIGSRETPPEIIKVMEDIATLMAVDGHILHTGAALGADQAFGNGANRVMGPMVIALPWATYERFWVDALFRATKIVYNQDRHHSATDSVRRFHPAAEKLKRGAFSLHARNFLIIENCTLIICWTMSGTVSGGTGQAIRIAETLNIPVHNLGCPETLNAYAERLEARKLELTAYL